MRTKVGLLLILLIYSCSTELNEDQLLKRLKEQYAKSIKLKVDKIRFSVEKDSFKGKKIYRISGWCAINQTNSDEWILAVCKDKKYKIIRHTAFMPLDSLEALKSFHCFE
ncbi:hypothetical protein ACG2LH_07105 [Zhouia sp. PK063]|uniref:hypothetical protein n=1 Tax=Zhouia sp. PK063 TaxID=3373602 RepID=UPI00379D58F7